VELIHPQRLDQEEIQVSFGAMELDPMDEDIIGVQLVGHDEIVNPSHSGPDYPASEPELSMVAIERQRSASTATTTPGQGAERYRRRAPTASGMPRIGVVGAGTPSANPDGLQETSGAEPVVGGCINSIS
jgi:hypothetical protein